MCGHKHSMYSGYACTLPKGHSGFHMCVQCQHTETVSVQVEDAESKHCADCFLPQESWAEND